MIILVTGTTHTGKTLLAQRLLEKYKYPYLSMDSLKMALVNTGYINIDHRNRDKLVDFIWPVVKEMIKYTILTNQNIIVEGGYMPMNWRKDFEGEFSMDMFKYICLAMSDSYIDNNFDKIMGNSSKI